MKTVEDGLYIYIYDAFAVETSWVFGPCTGILLSFPGRVGGSSGPPWAAFVRLGGANSDQEYAGELVQKSVRELTNDGLQSRHVTCLQCLESKQHTLPNLCPPLFFYCKTTAWLHLFHHVPRRNSTASAPLPCAAGTAEWPQRFTWPESDRVAICSTARPGTLDLLRGSQIILYSS